MRKTMEVAESGSTRSAVGTKEEDIVDDVKTAASSNLRERGKTAMKKVVETMDPPAPFLMSISGTWSMNTSWVLDRTLLGSWTSYWQIFFTKSIVITWNPGQRVLYLNCRARRTYPRV